MSNNIPLIESGQPFVKDECDRCGKTKATGTRFVRTGRVVFKCDECGKSNDLGFLEDVHEKQRSSVLKYDKASENRDRFWRENQEKQMMEFSRRKDDINSDAHEVFNLDYATKKWQF